MSWRPIDTTEVTQEFSNQEVQAIAALTQGGSLSNVPNLATILKNVVNEVRGGIIAGGNALDVIDGNVPDQLRDTVISIARWRWLSSAPALNQLKTKDREDLYNDAMKRLTNVINGTELVELPAIISSTIQSPANQVQTVSHMRRTTVHIDSLGRAHDKMRGLI